MSGIAATNLAETWYTTSQPHHLRVLAYEMKIREMARNEWPYFYYLFGTI